MQIPVLISDLAVMLLTAGIITLIFKRIRQPLVLGYILAGFLVSSYFPWFSTVSDIESIETWSEIGIIFLMFHLGLEFNLHKLAEVGSTAIITCIFDVAGMLGAGFFTGKLLGFTAMDSIVLGGMLAMSSTMVIIKVFDEMKIREKYAEGVFGTLVMQDIVGIFMMVILSTVSVSKNVSGGAVIGQLLIMLLYLVIWLVLGILVLPTFMGRTVKYMNDEMLMVLSLGICFGMVLLANRLGFSSALGAFLSGSLIAGTVHVERVEELTRGIKDLFGAVFFVSVGMMVDPGAIVKYIVPIAVLFAVTIIGKIVFNALGMLLSGQNLETSLKSGFALAQIGEFAFIIASLGKSLGVIDDFMYPIAVAISVVTVFTTPICIRCAGPFTAWLMRVLPEKWRSFLDRYTDENRGEGEKDSEWSGYLKNYFLRMIICGGFMLIAALVGVGRLEPALENHLSPMTASIVTCVLIDSVIVLLLRPLFDPHSDLFTSLWLRRFTNRLPLLALNGIRVLVVAVICAIPLREFFRLPTWLLTAAVLLVLAFVAKKGTAATWYLQIETRFLKNFNERLIRKEEAGGNRQEWLDEALFIMSFFTPEDADFIGKSLSRLNWGKNFNVYVVKIKKGEKQLLLPDQSVVIDSGDKVFVTGSEQALRNFERISGIPQTRPLRSVKQFMDTGYADVENALAMCPIKVRGDEKFAGVSLKQGKLREYKVALLGMQKDGLPLLMPDPNIRIQKGDILWIMGSNTNVGRLISEYVEEADA